MLPDKFFICLISFFIVQVKTVQSQVFIPFLSDSSKVYTIKNILLQGNKKTKDYIITRDITFEIEDMVAYKELRDLLERSMYNIFNTALFNEVKITAKESNLKSDELTIQIELKERWFIWPEPVLELYDRNYKVWSKVYKRDINRIKYGVKFKYNNFTGRRDLFRINLINGFSKEVSINYSQPFADKQLKHGFGLSAGYVKRIGVTFNHSSNGGLPRKLCDDDSCSTPNFRLFDSEDLFAGVNYQYRRGIYDRHILSLNYVKAKVADTIIKSNPDYFFNGRKEAQYLDINYSYSYSKVDYFAYPLEGQFLNFGFRKRFSNDGLGQLLVFGNFAKFIKIKNGFYFSTILSGSLRINKHDVSFLNMKTSDLSNGNIRGLEQYLILAKNDIALRNSIRYKILDTKLKIPIKIKNHEYLPLKFYARLFADAAYVYLPKPNFSVLHNKFLRTGGVAIDFITIYDVVFRFELSFNQIGNIGFFIR